MSGRPVWLASASLRGARGEIITTGRQTGAQRSLLLRALELLLGGVGDPRRERGFRMNITLCLHRALSDSEIAALPDSWHCELPVHLAGGPVEVIWSRGCEDAPSTRPCKRPVRKPLGPTWVPEDCGRCGPCQARAAIEQQVHSRGVGEVRR